MLKREQEDVLIGAILGDSHVEKNGKFCRVRFDHSIKQLPYLEWKRERLFPYSAPLSLYQVYDKRTGKVYKRARFNTYTTLLFNPYRDLFYQGGKKILPLNIESLLHSSLALAIWYLDDGSLKTDCKAYRPHTNSFTLSEVEILKRVLFKNFGIQSQIHKQGAGFLLYIGSKGSEAKRFGEILLPIVEKRIPSMLYKFF